MVEVRTFPGYLNLPGSYAGGRGDQMEVSSSIFSLVGSGGNRPPPLMATVLADFFPLSPHPSDQKIQNQKGAPTNSEQPIIRKPNTPTHKKIYK